MARKSETKSLEEQVFEPPFETQDEHMEQEPTPIAYRKAQFAVMKNGVKHAILRMDGKYIYCKDTQIRHSSPSLAEIVTEDVPN